MARDVFVHFEKMPDKSAVEKSLRDFVSTGAVVEWIGNRWFINLPGGPEDLPDKQPTRWIEVHVGSDNIDVMTRHADEFTNVLADGLARRFARQFDGVFGEI